jgi:hypothetical protein
MSMTLRTSTWLGALMLVGCSSPEPSPQVTQAPALQSAPAAADAVRPNKVLDPTGFSDPQVRRAYEAAKKYAHVLESIYCYCRCKENIGHRALVECFESDHGAHCDVCMTEAITVARMTEQGRTPQEIQKAIDAFYGG